MGRQESVFKIASTFFSVKYQVEIPSAEHILSFNFCELSCDKIYPFLRASISYFSNCYVLMHRNVLLLTSNRAAAFLQLVKLNKALTDAETTISLSPEWEKVVPFQAIFSPFLTSLSLFSSSFYFYFYILLLSLPKYAP